MHQPCFPLLLVCQFAGSWVVGLVFVHVLISNFFCGLYLILGESKSNYDFYLIDLLKQTMREHASFFSVGRKASCFMFKSWSHLGVFNENPNKTNKMIV